MRGVKTRNRETPDQRAWNVIAESRGYVLRGEGRMQVLATAPTIDVIATALASRSVRLFWPSKWPTGSCATEGLLLLPCSLYAGFVREVDAAVRGKAGRRVYGAFWEDETIALWTIPPVHSPKWWPRVTADEFDELHAAANEVVYVAGNAE